jgi:hypothetical protein
MRKCIQTYICTITKKILILQNFENSNVHAFTDHAEMGVVEDTLVLDGYAQPQKHPT